MQDCYYIAVDGGGSKTEFRALNVATGDSYQYFFGSSNYKISREDVEKEIILEGILHIFNELQITTSQVRGLVMGMSGCDSPSDYKHYLDIAASTKIARQKIYICNDSELAFYSKGTPPGLCIVAGTGSVATGIDKYGKKARSGGWGSPVSDEGSGAWIGIKILRKLLRFCDGYDEYLDIFEEILRHFKAESFSELPKMLSQCGITEFAGLRIIWE